ncbi:MAG: DinB family protein [Chloroflexota bacterium]|nr:DinB family protein [Chloroflexota bacterium]
MKDGASPFADPRLRELDPKPSPLPAGQVRARAGLARATPLFLSISDADLEREWDWIGEGEGDVRSAFYIAMQAFERAAGQVRRSPQGSAVGPAAGSIGVATEARWDLQGLLVSLDEVSLDADPGDGEWSVRRTLAHTLSSQRAYTWFGAWWMSRRDDADYPRHIPDPAAEQMEAQLPADERNADGSLADIRARLDALVDLTSELWRDASEDDLSVRARWMGFAVTTGFRVGRWSTHMQEHTIQVEKTLALLERAPTEVERMVRLLYRAFGRMESAAWVVGQDGDETAESPAQWPAQWMDLAVAEVEEIAAGVAEAATRR